MKIALIGYGKMGHAIEEAALSRGHEIVCRIDKDNQEDFDSVSFKSADVAIEFTAPSVLLKSVKLSVQDEKLRSPPRSNAVVYFILFISFGYLESEFNVESDVSC